MKTKMKKGHPVYECSNPKCPRYKYGQERFCYNCAVYYNLVEYSQHGGSRPGAGRPPSGLTPHQVKLACTDEQWAALNADRQARGMSWSDYVVWMHAQRAGEMRVIIQCVVALNNSAEEHGMGLWRLSSEFQRRIDAVLEATKESEK